MKMFEAVCAMDGEKSRLLRAGCAGRLRLPRAEARASSQAPALEMVLDKLSAALPRKAGVPICAGLAIVFSMQNGSGLAQPGALDTDFNPGAGVDQSVFALAVQPDGKIIIGGDFTTVAGVSRNGIALLNSNGALDSGFDPGLGANDQVSAVALQTNSVIIAGYFTQVDGINRGYLARLDSNGRLDTSFGPGSGADGPVLALDVQSDGKVLLGGEFSSISGSPRKNVARLNPDGSVDTDFNPGTGVSGTPLSSVRCMSVQGNGKLIIGGSFTSVNGAPRNHFARLNSDGSLDAGFAPNVDVTGAGFFPGVYSVAVQSDGKILVAGDFTRVNGIARTNIARLNSDGTLDMSFNPGSGPDFAVNSLAVQSNRKVVVAGFFTQVNGMMANYVARLDRNGDLDTGFDPGSGGDDAVYVAALQADGKVLLGGSFTHFSDLPRSGIARLEGDAVLSTPRLVNPVHANGVFKVSLATVNGENYFLEFKSSLTEDTWTTLPAVAGDGTFRTLIDPSATGPRAYYRVRVE
jgi:uncharacterized delta-60 repeat protein